MEEKKLNCKIKFLFKTHVVFNFFRYLNVALILVLLVFDANQILEEKKECEGPDQQAVLRIHTPRQCLLHLVYHFNPSCHIATARHDYRARGVRQ